jgi:multidrug resistance protein, MATE family
MNRKKTSVRKIIALGLPLFAGNFSYYLLQLADTIMVGRLGTDNLAAIAMAGLFSGILFTFVWPVLIGTQAVSSRRFGKQQVGEQSSAWDSLIAETGLSLDNGIVVGIFVGTLGLIFSFTANPVLSILIKDPNLLPLAMQYVSVFRWILPFSGIMMSMTGFLGGINRTKNIMVSNIGGSLLNILFNYIFIFGKIGFPAFGIKGAAIGTVLAGSFQFLYLFSVIRFDRKLRPYKMLSFRTLELNMMKSMFRILLPLAIQNMFALAVFLIYESIIGYIGTVYLAATHVIFSIFRINKTLVGGFAQGSAILVGNALGAEDKEAAVNFVKGCQKIASFIGFFVVTSVLFFPETIMGIFVKDPQTIEIGTKALYFFAVFFFIEVMGYSFEIIFGGNGWGRYVLFSELVSNIVFIIGLTLILVYVFNKGIYGAWIGFALYQVFHALILFLGFLSKKWLHIEVEKK